MVLWANAVWWFGKILPFNMCTFDLGMLWYRGTFFGVTQTTCCRMHSQTHKHTNTRSKKGTNTACPFSLEPFSERRHSPKRSAMKDPFRCLIRKKKGAKMDFLTEWMHIVATAGQGRLEHGPYIFPPAETSMYTSISVHRPSALWCAFCFPHFFSTPHFQHNRNIYF